MNHYQLINYFDVWGNAEDGWEVNNQCIEMDDVTICDNATAKDILNYLVTVGFLVTADLRRLAVEDWGEMIEIYEKNGNKPIAALMQKF